MTLGTVATNCMFRFAFFLIVIEFMTVVATFNVKVVVDSTAVGTGKKSISLIFYHFSGIVTDSNSALLFCTVTKLGLGCEDEEITIIFYKLF